jgi:microcin C transport system permease protein
MNLTYLLRRLSLLLVTAIALSILVFGLTRFVPGGPAEQLIAAASQGETGAHLELSADQIAELNAFYGLDQPFLAAYVEWFSKLFHGDLGTSFRFQEPVTDLLLSRSAVTLSYGLCTLILLYGLALPLGFLKALYHNTLFDSLSSLLLLVLRSVPGFVVGLFLLSIFSVRLDFFPMSGFASDHFGELNTWQQVGDLMRHGFLPIVSYTIGLIAYLTFLTKNALLENLSAEYMRFAVAKGFRFSTAVYRHALRNSLIALAPYVGSSLALLVGGSFLIETIFTIEGLGLLGYEALLQRDYPLVMGVILVTSLVLLLGNLLSDIMLTLLNPRIRFEP